MKRLAGIGGALLVLAGACYFVHSFAGFVASGFAAKRFPAILAPGALAELALAPWLFPKGIRETKWRALQGV